MCQSRPPALCGGNCPGTNPTLRHAKETAKVQARLHPVLWRLEPVHPRSGQAQRRDGALLWFPPPVGCPYGLERNLGGATLVLPNRPNYVLRGVWERFSTRWSGSRGALRRVLASINEHLRARRTKVARRSGGSCVRNPQETRGLNQAASPNRRPQFPLHALADFVYRFRAPPLLPAAVGEPHRWVK